ncbi:DUF1800 domain-containing protein [Catenovulum sediminis]|uniref:DUF1800 domain-containing protein n=1 Tax=Catenovulum sediminis TaxID=1740262 RepID=A0ABV1RCL6_9ALTE|nr:DUF1800 domain-containing protein [Catenovulum sediminis]
MVVQYSAEIALNRFALGAKPQQISVVQKDPRAWLYQQLKPLHFSSVVGESSASWTSEQALQATYQYRVANQKSKAANTNQSATKNTEQNPMMSQDIDALRKQINQSSLQLAADTFHYAIETDMGFQARLLDFFSNHFSVTMSGNVMRAIAPTLEREAIAPHIAGKFEDLLLAVEQHPAMLIYLNNERSVGPNSKFARKRKNKGLNENLAREILELHTLGVNGGYQQNDVKALAKAITGWSVGHPKYKQAGKFIFRIEQHEPGTRTILAKRYAQSDVTQGEAILRDLAVHPATAQHISFKLARHFIADQPAPKLVDDMTKVWLTTGGDLKAVLSCLIDHPLSWQTQPQKFKTPREFAISAYRATGVKFSNNRRALEVLKVLGQFPFAAGSPAGYGDVASAWDGSEAFMARIEWSEHISARVKKMPLEIAQACLGEQLTERTATYIKRAESRQQACALLLMSPEFQRR